MVASHSQAHTARHLTPGAKLGKYDLIRPIAVGGMAELYLARTVGLEGFEKLVVVKRILPQFAEQPGFIQMFLDEARLAATLHHPNIAQVYDIGIEAGSYFFSMEYVHGEDLRRMIASSHDQGVPLSLDAALTLAVGVAAGLHYAHQKAAPDGAPLGIVHRDVSPSNVLVSYEGGVKVVDFGIARANSRQSSTLNGGLKGKIAYMSPEQCRGGVSLDRRSDIFSIGTMLYELSTGTLPFAEESEFAVLHRIVNTDVEPPSKRVPAYPPQLEAIVLRAMARDPAKRYPTALELQRDLEDFAHDNRLRISPLTLGRLMENLFPAALAEWENAVSQGAYFVEDLVVKTLVGKTSDYQGALPVDEDTAAVKAPADDELTDMVLTVPTVAPAAARPLPPRAVPIVIAPAPTAPTAPTPAAAAVQARRLTPPPVELAADRTPPPPAPPGGLAAANGLPLPAPDGTYPGSAVTAQARERSVAQTARVSVAHVEAATARALGQQADPTELAVRAIAPARSRGGWMIAAGLVVIGGVFAFVRLTRHEEPARAAAPALELPANDRPIIEPIAAEPPAVVAPAPAVTPVPAPLVAPMKTEPEVAVQGEHVDDAPAPDAPAPDAPVIKAPGKRGHHRSSSRKKDPPRKAEVRKAEVRKAEPRPADPPKPEPPKEEPWTEDSPFMPVRPGE